VKIKGKVVIGSGSFVCKNSVIASGVSTGTNSVVGPNSFLTKDLPSYKIAIGNPARIFNY
jgi:acetyltransferase-like isoleucine patch superfamily enzyme